MKNMVKLLVLAVLTSVSLSAMAMPIPCTSVNDWTENGGSFNGVQYYICQINSSKLWCGTTSSNTCDAPIGIAINTQPNSFPGCQYSFDRTGCVAHYKNTFTCSQQSNWHPAGTAIAQEGSDTQNIPYYTCNEKALGNNQTQYCSTGAGNFTDMLGINSDVSQNTLTSTGAFPCGINSASSSSCSACYNSSNYLNNNQ